MLILCFNSWRLFVLFIIQYLGRFVLHNGFYQVVRCSWRQRLQLFQILIKVPVASGHQTWLGNPRTKWREKPTMNGDEWGMFHGIFMYNFHCHLWVPEHRIWCFWETSGRATLAKSNTSCCDGDLMLKSRQQGTCCWECCCQLRQVPEHDPVHPSPEFISIQLKTTLGQGWCDSDIFRPCLAAFASRST